MSNDTIMPVEAAAKHAGFRSVLGFYARVAVTGDLKIRRLGNHNRAKLYVVLPELDAWIARHRAVEPTKPRKSKAA